MKKSFVYLPILLAGLFLAATRIWAEDEPQQDADFQDNPAAVSVSDIEGLNNRISALEKNGNSSFKVTGLLQFWYTHLSYGVATGARYSSSKNQWDAFSFKRGEIGLVANIAGDPKLTFGFKFDPSQASFNGLGGSNGSLLDFDGGSPAITITGPVTVNGKAATLTPTAVNLFTIVKDLYGKVSYSPYVTFTFGQNKFAQDLEGRWSTNDLDFNNYSNIGGNGFGNKRDAGVQLEGLGIPLGPLQGEYVLSVIQGSGQSTADNNVDKDLAGRVGFTYDKNLFLGASAYDGWEPNGARWDIGLEGRWVYKGLKAKGEFIEGNLNTADNNAANNSFWTPSVPSSFKSPTGQINPTGYYLFTNYRYQDWRLGIRWDGYNFNQWKGSPSNTEWDTVTIGLDWFQAKDAYRLSLNWEDHLLKGVDEYNAWTVQSQISL